MNLAHLRAWRKAWFVTNDIEANAALEIADRAAAAKDKRALLATRVHATERFDAHHAAYVTTLRASGSLRLDELATSELWDAVRAYVEVLIDGVDGLAQIPTLETRTLFVRAAAYRQLAETNQLVTAAKWNAEVLRDCAKVIEKFTAIEEESWQAHVVNGGAS